MDLLTADVAATLAAYEARYGSPTGRVDLLRAALDAGRSVTSRKDLPIHVTCGVVVRDPDGRILQIRHRALDRWLLPGGHLEPGDDRLISAARREAFEETGLVTGDAGSAEVRPVPVDIDIHPIPASAGKGEPGHHHADFRYVVQAVDGAIRLQADEVSDWRWADPTQIDNPRLAERLGSEDPTEMPAAAEPGMDVT
jgi:8-oxo-dGTP pyrophosphatase MutT (NUDIX family)